MGRDEGLAPCLPAAVPRRGFPHLLPSGSTHSGIPRTVCPGPGGGERRDRLGAGGSSELEARQRGLACCCHRSEGCSAAGAEAFVKEFCLFFQLGNQKKASAAAACTCGVKKKGAYDAGWLQHSGIVGEAG